MRMPCTTIIAIKRSQKLKNRLTTCKDNSGSFLEKVAQALIIVLVIAFIAFIGILAAIAIPAYQDYTTRARLVEAVSIGDSAAESIAQYYYQHQAIPVSLEAAGFTASLPSSVKNIAVDSQNGVVNITMATTPIEDKKLQLVPSLDTNNQIIWQCMSQEIPDKYLPGHCRQQQ
jgi:Tfp pilus assembly protein PilE